MLLGTSLLGCCPGEVNATPAEEDVATNLLAELQTEVYLFLIPYLSLSATVVVLVSRCIQFVEKLNKKRHALAEDDDRVFALSKVLIEIKVIL